MAKQKRRDLFHLAGAGALASLGIPHLRAAATTIPNMTKAADAANPIPDPAGDLRVYFGGPTEQLKDLTAGSFRLKPGATPHAPHRHPEEEVMVITEGTGEIVVEGKTTPVVSGSMMFCAGNKLHGIRNTGSAPLMFYYFKWKA